MKRCLANGAALAVLAIVSGPAAAEPYAGASILSSEYQYEDVGHGTGSKLFAGYHFSAPLLLEVSKIDLGHPKVDNFTDGYGNSLQNGALGFTGYNYSLGYFGSTPSPGLGFWAKVGYYSGDATLRGTVNGYNFNTRESSSGFSWGIGADWMFTRHVGLLFDLEGMEGVKDLPQIDSGHDSSVTVASLGLVVTFQSTEPAPVVAQPMTPALPPVAPPDPVAQAPQLAAPPPAAPAAIAPAPESTATAEAPAPAVETAAAAVTPSAGEWRALRDGAVLRARPVASSSGDAAVASSAHLVSRAQNPDGAWWFVEQGAARGWVLEADLGPVAAGAN